MGQICTLVSEKGERIYLKALRHDYLSEVDLTWEDRFNVPSHDSIEEGIKQHHDSWCGDAKAIFFQWALKEVVPLNTNSLLLKERKVLTTETKGYWRQQALKMGGMNIQLVTSVVAQEWGTLSIWKVQVPQTITVFADMEWHIWSTFQEAWNLYWTSTQNCLFPCHLKSLTLWIFLQGNRSLTVTLSRLVRNAVQGKSRWFLQPACLVIQHDSIQRSRQLSPAALLLLPKPTKPSQQLLPGSINLFNKPIPEDFYTEN